MLIIIDDVITEVRKILKERPNVRYKKDGPSCYYDSGACTVGCIFGQALRALGLNVSGSNGICNILKQNDIKTNHDQREWCLKVQAEQDNGGTWEEALKLADLTGGV